MDFNLEGKTALVTGCSQGLGYASVLTLARHGADIFGVSIGDDSELKKEVENMGRRYHSVTVSLTTPGAIHSLMKEVLAAYGHIDILLNFANILKKEDTLQITRQEFDTAIDLNITAAFFLTQEVIKQFQKQGTGGKIINASGILPYDTSEYCVYATSKGAIDQMTRYLAHEFAGRQIQINSVIIGFMTDGTRLQCGNGGEVDETILKQIPAGRWGSYRDLEGLILLLASNASDYITGACIPVDGGYSI